MTVPALFPPPVPGTVLGPAPGVSVSVSVSAADWVLALGVGVELGVGVAAGLALMGPPLLPEPELGVPFNQRLNAVFVNSRDWGTNGATSEFGDWIGTRPRARGETRTIRSDEISHTIFDSSHTSERWIWKISGSEVGLKVRC